MFRQRLGSISTGFRKQNIVFSSSIFREIPILSLIHPCKEGGLELGEIEDVRLRDLGIVNPTFERMGGCCSLRTLLA